MLVKVMDNQFDFRLNMVRYAKVILQQKNGHFE